MGCVPFLCGVYPFCVCVCVSVCVSIHIFIYLFIYMNDFVCMYIHVHLFLCICACMFVYGHICLCVAMDEDACMYVQCIYKCTDVCTVCMKTYVYASLHLGVHVCLLHIRN